MRSNFLTCGYDRGRTSVRVPGIRSYGNCIYGLVGPNGSGKTTLLRTLSGALEPLAGSVEYPQGQGGGPFRIGYDSHDFGLMHGARVRDQVDFWSADKDGERAAAIRNALGIDELAGKRVEDLSEGQSRRVSLACTFCSEPDAYIFDEPLSGLDVVYTRRVREMIRDNDCPGFTLVTSHDLRDITAVCEFVATIRDGEMSQWRPVAEVIRPSRTREVHLLLEPVERDASDHPYVGGSVPDTAQTWRTYSLTPQKGLSEVLAEVATEGFKCISIIDDEKEY